MRTSSVFATTIALMSVVLSGCHREKETASDDRAGPDSYDSTSDTLSDLSHVHKHFHDEFQSHEHDHGDELIGTHSHLHAHQHRHAEPLFGGQIVAIGHSDHYGAAPRYHAEIMPINEEKVEIHFLVESGTGEFIVFPIREHEFVASVTAPAISERVFNVRFVSSDDDQSFFQATLPEEISRANAVDVKFPQIQLGDLQAELVFTVRKTASSSLGD